MVTAAHAGYSYETGKPNQWPSQLCTRLKVPNIKRGGSELQNLEYPKAALRVHLSMYTHM